MNAAVTGAAGSLGRALVTWTALPVRLFSMLPAAVRDVVLGRTLRGRRPPGRRR